MSPQNKCIFFWSNLYFDHPEIGTTQKILSEIKTLRSMDYKVFYSANLDNGVAIFDNEDNIVLYKEFLIKNSLFLKAFRREYLVNISRQFIRNNPFRVYLLRINCINTNYFKMLKEMKNHGAYVMMESLSYYPNMNFGKIKKASYLMIAHSLKKHSKHLKEVIDLMLTEGILDDFYGIPCVEFGMGVDVDNYKIHNYTGNKEDLNLIMVGCDSIYHGTDRIIRSIKDYYDNNKYTNRKIYLHLVGNIHYRDKKHINASKLDDKIICYGPLHGEKLDNIFDKCNIALGPLAQHRIKKKDTGLKTKEYFARGIPYLYTGDEVNIERDFQYILQLPDTEDILDWNHIFNFYDRIKNHNSLQDEMRCKAISVFSWRTIFDRVFKVYEKVNQLK